MILRVAQLIVILARAVTARPSRNFDADGPIDRELMPLDLADSGISGLRGDR